MGNKEIFRIIPVCIPEGKLVSLYCSKVIGGKVDAFIREKIRILSILASNSEILLKLKFLWSKHLYIQMDVWIQYLAGILARDANLEVISINKVIFFGSKNNLIIPTILLQEF